MNEPITKPRYIPFKCVNCAGFRTVAFGKHICPTCKGTGITVIDQETGLPVEKNDDNYGSTTT